MTDTVYLLYYRHDEDWQQLGCYESLEGAKYWARNQYKRDVRHSYVLSLGEWLWTAPDSWYALGRREYMGIAGQFEAHKERVDFKIVSLRVTSDKDIGLERGE